MQQIPGYKWETERDYWRESFIPWSYFCFDIYQKTTGARQILPMAIWRVLELIGGMFHLPLSNPSLVKYAIFSIVILEVLSFHAITMDQNIWRPVLGTNL